jgi:phosphate transport system ATP-binding protein
MSAPAKLSIEQLTVSYAGKPALHGLSLSIAANSIHAVIGPAGSGKTSLLRTLNLLAVEVDRASVSGRVRLEGVDLFAPLLDRAALRRRVGMVFASPQPLPGSIYDNLTFGPRRSGMRARPALDALVESALKSADLWEEVKDRLGAPASTLSGGQQQRLCIARALALSPEVVLLDEPCSGLDPISTYKIEQMMRSLRSRLTWVIVTNNTKQAARVSDRTAFLLSGELVEDAPTTRLFTAPQDPRTAAYVEGRFG